MTVIDTLKFAQTMREAGMPEMQAEALAGALDQSMKDTVATRDVLSATISDFKAEMAEFKAEIKADMTEFKAEIKAEMADFKAEIKAEMADFKAEIKAEIAEFKAEIRTEMAQLATTLTNRMYGIAVGIVTATGLIQYFVK